MKIGIIGAGRIGRVHAQSISQRIPQASAIAVADLYLEAAQSCANDFSIPHATGDYNELLTNPDIDAVLICSSTDTHTQYITEAAQAGKHIFCEKPIALDLAAIDSALAAVDKAGVKLQIGFNRRFDANFRHLHETVKAGGIGIPHLVRIISRDPAPPPIDYINVSGGIFLDMTIHDFDMARYLIEDEVEEIYAAGGVMIDPAIGAAGDIDTAAITLKYKSGALCLIDNSRQAVYGYDQRAEVFGSKGAIESGNRTDHNTIHSTVDGVLGQNPQYFFLERYMDSYVEEIRAFIDAVQNDTDPLVQGIDGRIPVVMGMAAQKSYRENRPVKLSEIN